MGEVLIQLEVPALKMQYDVFVPTDLEVGKLVEILVSGVIDLSNGKYCRSGYEQLAMKDPDQLLNPTRSLAEYAVPEGAEMMLL